MVNDRVQGTPLLADPSIGQRSYPDKLKQAEEALIRQRPGREHFKCDQLVGLGLSGGGIRSASFGFGVLQSLARH